MKTAILFVLLSILTFDLSYGNDESIEALKKRIADLEREIEILKATRDITVPEIKVQSVKPLKFTEIVVTLRKDGSAAFNGKKTNNKDLLKFLTQAIDSYADQPVLIRGEDAVTYRRVTEILDSCTKAGAWNISFATIRPETEQGGPGQSATEESKAQ